MSECLECQRLKQQIKDLEWKFLIQAQKWIELKRFILGLDAKTREQQSGN